MAPLRQLIGGKGAPCLNTISKSAAINSPKFGDNPGAHQSSASALGEHVEPMSGFFAPGEI
jgi:hypothetical protein